MKRLITLCAILGIPAFAGDPKQLLPATPVTIHGTMSAWDAYLVVGKSLGVNVKPDWMKVKTSDAKPDQSFVEAQLRRIAELKSISVTLNLDKATGAQAFDAITAVTHWEWEVWPNPKNGPVLVTLIDD
jgi:hypothetical protein